MSKKRINRDQMVEEIYLLLLSLNRKNNDDVASKVRDLLQKGISRTYTIPFLGSALTHMFHVASCVGVTPNEVCLNTAEALVLLCNIPEE